MEEHPSAARRAPLLQGFVRRLKARVGQARFKSSATYWEKRYRRGGNSGAGSYNRLAAFKAQVLNDFVAEHRVQSVIEFGSGDGAQLDLAEYPTYVGVDISRTAINATRQRFLDNSNIRFLHTSEVPDDACAELALSIDVIYHLVEDVVFETYMTQLFEASTKFVVIYSSNEDKNWASPHVRHRQFTRWIHSNMPQFKLVKMIPNAYPYSEDDPENTSFADFYIFSCVD